MLTPLESSAIYGVHKRYRSFVTYRKWIKSLSFLTGLRLKLFILMVVLNILSGCAVVPVTGRKQFSLIPYSELIALSKINYEQVLGESKLSQDNKKVQTVREVGGKIAIAAEQFMRQNTMTQEIQNYQWEFRLIKDDELANAFCMPGGKVAVYTGILTVTQDENGLATVLSHEIAHAVLNHGGERLSQLLIVQLGEATLSEALSRKPQETIQTWREVYGIGTNLGIILPYSRTQELEADRIGLILMSKAGYDPNTAIAFWQRMKDKEKYRPLEFLSTHPIPERRIEDIRKYIPEAMKYYKKVRN